VCSAGLWLMPFTDPAHLAAGADVLLHTLLELTA
jgi:hypothetical protein